MYDYRNKIKPSGPSLSMLETEDGRKDAYRRRAVELFTSGYTRDDLSVIFGKKKHAVAEIIRLAKEQLGAADDIELTLIAHGIPLRHTLSLSKYMKVIEMGSPRPTRYVYKMVDLLVRGYKRAEIASFLGKDKHSMEVVSRVAMIKLGMSSWVEVTLLAHDIIDGRDFCLDKILKGLTESSVSGKIRVNAEQLPRTTAEGSSQKGHADSQPGDRTDAGVRGVPAVPGGREAAPADAHAG